MTRAFGAARIAASMGARLPIAALAAALIATPAQAQNWVSISQGESGSELLIDMDSVETGAVASAWVMINYASPQRGAHYATYRWQVNCAAQTIRIRNAVRFNAEGEAIWSYDRADQDFTPVEPGTFFETAMHEMCGTSTSIEVSI